MFCCYFEVFFLRPGSTVHCPQNPGQKPDQTSGRKLIENVLMGTKLEWVLVVVLVVLVVVLVVVS